MDLKLVTPPVSEPIETTDMKLYLRVDHDDEDDLISAMIPTARQYCEDFQRRAIPEQTWELILDCFPDTRFIRIPRPPLQSVESFTYTGEDGTEHTFDDYTVNTDAEPGIIALESGASWPNADLYPTGAIRIRFVAGYSESNPVPETTIQAMRLMIGHWYVNRESVVIGSGANKVPLTAETLLWSHRTW